jgi:hypothetical protein
VGGGAVVAQADLLVQFARERLGRDFVSFQASARRTPDRQPAPGCDEIDRAEDGTGRQRPTPWPNASDA